MLALHGIHTCKNYVSVARNTHMQKWLLLCDLKELYAAFKQNYPHLKTGFSKFCSLRPKWCVLVGCSGTHSVCVCTNHQNVILMLGAVNLDKDHHELMDMMVCSRDSKECMIHRCKNCPADAFPRARALKTQIFKKLKRIFCAFRYKNNWLFCILEHHIHEGMFNLKNLKVYSYGSFWFSV